VTTTRTLPTSAPYSYGPGDYAISPDGKYAAFVTDTNTTGPDASNDPVQGDDIVLVNLQTGQETLITTTTDQPNAGSGQLTFSPDGTKLIFASEATNLVDYDFSYPAAPQHDKTYVTSPSPSADGTAANAYANLYSFDIASRQTSLILVPDTSQLGPTNEGDRISTVFSTVTAQSASGSIVAYQYDHTETNPSGQSFFYAVQDVDAYRITNDPSKPDLLFSTATYNNGNAASSPSLSANGEWLAYSQIQATATDALGFPIDRSDVYLVDLSGAAKPILVSRTTDGTPASSLTPTLDNDPSGAYDPVISADGSTLYFVSNADLTSQSSTGGIYRYDIATGALTLLTAIAGSGGSTDANWTLATDIINGENDSIQPDGLSLSADGRYLAVGGNGAYSYPESSQGSSDNVDDGNGFQTTIIDTQTGKVVTQLGAESSFPKMSADGKYLVVVQGQALTLIDLKPPTISVASLNGDEAIDAAQLADYQAHGFSISGTTTNVEAGNVVTVGFDGATTTATVGTDGSWTAKFDASVANKLVDGQTYSITASVGDNAGTTTQSPVSIVVDTTPPSEYVNGLAITGGDTITTDERLSGQSLHVTGTLDAPLAAGDAVIVKLNDATNDTVTATVSKDGLSFYADLPVPQSFGAVQAYVVDEARNQSPTLTHDYQLAPTTRLIYRDGGTYGIGFTTAERAVISADGNHIVYETDFDGLNAQGNSDNILNLYELDIRNGTAPVSGTPGQLTQIASTDTNQLSSYSNSNSFYGAQVDGDGGTIAYRTGPSNNGSNVEVYSGGTTANVSTDANNENFSGDQNVYDGTSPIEMSSDGKTVSYGGGTYLEEVVTTASGQTYYLNTQYGSSGPEGNVYFQYAPAPYWAVLDSDAHAGIDVATNNGAGWDVNAFPDWRSPTYASQEQVPSSLDIPDYTQNGRIIFDTVPDATIIAAAPDLPVDKNTTNPSSDAYYDWVLGHSADGNAILFLSSDGLTGNFQGGQFSSYQLYEYNVTTGETTLVSSDDTGAEISFNGYQGSVEAASMSSDGRYVAFEIGGLNSSTYFDSIYVKDTQTGAVQFVGYGQGSDEMISADGRFVTYDAYIPNYNGTGAASGIVVADLYAPAIDINPTAETDDVAGDEFTGYYLNKQSIESEPGTTVSFSGHTTLASGTVVTLSLAGQDYSGTVDQAGEWTVAAPRADIEALTAGQYVVTASATDDADRLVSETVTYTIDPTKPSTPIITGLTAATDSGVSDSDGITNVATPVLRGTADPGDIILLEDKSSFALLGHGTVDNTGHFAITISPAAGINSVIAVAENEVGELGDASAPYQLTYEPATDAPSSGTSTPDINASMQATELTFTISLASQETLDASDFVLDVSGKATGTISAVTGSGETYQVTVSDISGVGALGVSLASAAEALDVAGNPQPVAETLHQVDVPLPQPVLYTGDAVTNQTYVDIFGAAPGGSEAISIYDDFDGTNTLVGTTTSSSDGSPYFDLILSDLTEGDHHFTAVAEDPTSGAESTPSDAANVTIDLTPPAEQFSSVTVNNGAPISVAQQNSDNTVDLHGVLTSPLLAGDQVDVVLPDGEVETATPSADRLSFDAPIPVTGVSGTLSVYLADEAGNTGAQTTVSYTADHSRTITRLTASASDPNTSASSSPSLSGDASKIAFWAFPALVESGYPDGTMGIAVEDTATGAEESFLPNAYEPVLSSDGGTLAYVAHDPATYALEVYTLDLTTPGATPLLITANANGQPDGFSADAPSLSADGSELVFSSSSTDLNATGTFGGLSDIFLAHIANGAVTSIEDIAGDSTGYSGDAIISADGSTLVFDSTVTDYPGASTDGYEQVYAESLTGPDAGQITLIGGPTTDGASPNGGESAPAVSGDGRYVVFVSSSTNLAPSNLGAGDSLNGYQQIYLEDRLTGNLTLISADASGAPGDGDSSAPTISSDGETISFSSWAGNLGPANNGQSQIYVVNISAGTITLVSEAGGVPGDASSNTSSLSADGHFIAFDSSSSNIVDDDTNDQSDVFFASTAPDESNVPCYCPGTLIATERGDVLVEDLVIGDRVLTFTGVYKPIKWIGRRSYAGRFVLGRKDILPVCITRGAIDENVPRRDLWVSPHHAIYLDGILIEAKDLINDVTIYQADLADEIDYFHIELEAHDIILADGAWAESFLGEDTRGMFHNAHQYRALYPNETRMFERYYAPRLEEGPAVERLRQKLDDRAALFVSMSA